MNKTQMRLPLQGGLRPGPMLQIWGNNEASNLGAVDEADSGAPAGFGKVGHVLVLKAHSVCRFVLAMLVRVAR